METEFSNLYLWDVFLNAMYDLHLRKLIRTQGTAFYREKKTLKLACRLEAIDSSGMMENTSDSHRQKHRPHQLEMDSTNESGSKEINKQLGEMRNAYSDDGCCRTQYWNQLNIFKKVQVTI